MTMTTVLRILAAGPQGGKGDQGVGGTGIPFLNSVAELRGVDKTTTNTAVTLGYYAKGDGGGNIFYYDSSDTTSLDNGGTIIVGTDGGRWKAFKSNEVTTAEFGMVGLDAVGDQVCMDALLASSAQIVHLMPGVHRAYLANGASNRTFICHPGAIIDGVVHLMIGTGPDNGGGPVVPCQHVTVIGNLVSTIRIGSYYAQWLHASAATFRITGISGAYYNQSNQSAPNIGPAGVHLYYGSQHMRIGEIVVEATNSPAGSGYGFAADISTHDDADHWVTDVSIGKMTINGCTESGMVLTKCVDLRIDECALNSYNGYGGITAVGADVHFGKLFVDGSSSTGAHQGIRVQGGKFTADELEVKNSGSYGLFAFGGAVIEIGKLTSTGHASYGVELRGTTGFIREIIANNNAGFGYDEIADSGPVASTMNIGRVQGTANTGGLVNVVSSVDSYIGEILATGHTAASNYTVVFNTTVRQTMGKIRVDGTSGSGSQGLRLLNNTDIDLGSVVVSNCTYAITESGDTGLTYSWIHRSGNGADGATLSAATGFYGARKV